eukprot:12893605-Alexandrium_andersonii.AAC.1
MDYCFLAKDGSDASLTVFVAKDRGSRAILARAVLCKGRLRDDAVDQATTSISGGSDTAAESCPRPTTSP